MVVTTALLLAALLVQQPETLSLIGEPLRPPKLSADERAKADEAMRAAMAAYAKTPNDVASIVALADAHVTFGRVGDAIEILTRGLEVNADDPRLLAERGRDFVLLRKFDLAQRDLRKAVETIPSAHCALGFAQYLTGAFPHAQSSYAKCSDPGIFGYLSARRAGAAAARPEVERESLAAAYLAAAELLVEGRKEDATRRLEEMVEKKRREWMDPGYIAAEADYARLYKPPRRK
jgi:tetratricopeptide (TPR) repeat protein